MRFVLLRIIEHMRSHCMKLNIRIFDLSVCYFVISGFVFGGFLNYILFIISNVFGFFIFLILFSMIFILFCFILKLCRLFCGFILCWYNFSKKKLIFFLNLKNLFFFFFVILILNLFFLYKKI